MAECISIEREPKTAIAAALPLLAQGAAIAIPTETVYGLAADATNPQAITRIYETKGRPRFNPLICHMADLAMAERHARFDPLSRTLAERFWPGPLTLILPLQDGSPIHPLATAGLDTVGVRCPRGFAGQLIAAFGQPLAAPSANTSGRISPTSATHVEADLGDKIPLILDGGTAGVGVESTIVKVENGAVHLLRPGGLAAEEIEACLGLSLIRPEKAGAIIEAPGMLASHYAPDAPVRLNALEIHAGEAAILFGRDTPAGLDKAHFIRNLSPEGKLAEAAAALFQTMKEADASGAARIAFVPIPMQGLGEAINDRIERAAAPRA
ncbi:L-threonylcarbamoyladenylate synthase [Allorhizobium sp. BGMRC 0089]|uniref:L-threonylcarbamoyladenylate synthase n=1 Tax=Allorhizobium sonneratiae TaxID=2934936 RepID=UPI00203466DD|nr:L-threonylcarbamoyladenylate synthase [Allorhizobium sonneratiae]MCM2294546.1 L-threonylcarbamoyladenylate synthase [Allorhizobium sonneratiae]